MRSQDSYCFTHIQLRLVLWKKYPDKIEEIKADAKWKELEQMLGLITADQQLKQWVFLTFIKRNILLAS